MWWRTTDCLLFTTAFLPPSADRCVCVKGCSSARLLTRFKCELIVLLPSLLPSDVLFSHKICHLWDGEGHDGQQKSGPHALLPEGLAGSLWRCDTPQHRHTHAYKLCQTTTSLTLYEQDSLADSLERQPTWWTSGMVISFITYLLGQLCWSRLSKKTNKTKHGTFLSLECRMTWNCPQNWGESELVLWNFRWMKNLLVQNVLLKQKAKMPLFAV